MPKQDDTLPENTQDTSGSNTDTPETQPDSSQDTIQPLNEEDIINFDNNIDSIDITHIQPIDETTQEATEEVEINQTTIIEDTIPENIPSDEADIIQSPLQEPEVAPQPTDDDHIEVVHIKHTDSTNVPRVKDPETESEAETFFIAELNRRYRFLQYDNALNPLSYDEKLDGLYDALEEINQYSPQTDYTLLHFATVGRRYRRLLLIGAAKYCILTLVSHWTSDGIDVAVEDLSVSNKLSDFQSLLQTLTEQFNEGLSNLKEYDRLTVKSSTFSTGGRRFSQSSAMGRRASSLTSGGRIIG